MSQEVMNELVNMSFEIIKLKDQRRELLEALKDSYPFVSSADLRARIGNLIVKAEGIAA